jgi:hypothetical protein
MLSAWRGPFHGLLDGRPAGEASAGEKGGRSLFRKDLLLTVLAAGLGMACMCMGAPAPGAAGVTETTGLAR